MLLSRIKEIPNRKSLVFEKSQDRRYSKSADLNPIGILFVMAESPSWCRKIDRTKRIFKDLLHEETKTEDMFISHKYYHLLNLTVFLQGLLIVLSVHLGGAWLKTQHDIMKMTESNKSHMKDL